MGGLAEICKLYGKFEAKGEDGRTVLWVYDYATDRPRLQSEMTLREMAESEVAKAKLLGEQKKVKKKHDKNKNDQPTLF